MPQSPVSPKKAVVLLSGGLDSATALAMAASQGWTTYALSFAYGQRQAVELDAARRVAQHRDVTEHRVATLDLRSFGGSALTSDIDVPKSRTPHAMKQGIPVTYVPARNTIFLSYALAWAEVLEAFDIFIGVSAVDYSGYPDCRPEYIAAFERMANLALATTVQGKGSLTIHAPLMHMTKAEIIRAGAELDVDYGLTHSCYDPISTGSNTDSEHPTLACGACDACQLRRRGFEQAEIPDPTHYATKEQA